MQAGVLQELHQGCIGYHAFRSTDQVGVQMSRFILWPGKLARSMYWTLVMQAVAADVMFVYFLLPRWLGKMKP